LDINKNIKIILILYKKSLKQVICTISTTAYLPKVAVLYESLKGNTEFDFYCLITDKQNIISGTSAVQYLTLGDIEALIPSKIFGKYKGDALRWGSKPLLIQYLIQKGYGKVIYVDNDIYFTDSPQIIFEYLEKNLFLLTPHFYQSNPNRHARWFEANFRVGLYNAGFIACTSESLDILRWWQGCCEYNIKKRFFRGLFDDQKYLDLIPVLFDGVSVVKERRWNMAAWNDFEYDYVIPIDSKIQPLFIHFTALTLEKWGNEEHPFFHYYQNYVRMFKNQEFPLTSSRKRHLIAVYFRYLYWKIERAIEK